MNTAHVIVLGLALTAAPMASALAAPPSPSAAIRAVETGLRPAVDVQGSPPVRWTIQERMAFYHVPAVSIAVIRDGRVAWTKAWGVRQAGAGEAVDADTMFSVGSVSKVATAAITLRMVSLGELDLDHDVRDYLKRWRIPDAPAGQGRPVTLREIMSHTAGFTVSGFPDYQPSEALPTEIDTLEGRRPAKTGPVTFAYAPGDRALYSGGGITVEQVVIEDRSGAAFNAAAQRYLFGPLGMQRSTFENPLPAATANVAKAHDMKGAPTALPRGWEAMPEMAASGLWTTPREYAKILIALMAAYRGAPDAFISQDLARQMMTPVGPSRVGLGPFMDGAGLTRRFSHTGSNDSYKAYFEGHLATGDGLVIFTNSANAGGIRDEIRRAVAAAEGWGMSDAVTVPAVALSEADRAALSGSYRAQPTPGIMDDRIAIDGMPNSFLVTDADGALWVAANGVGPRERLVPEGPTQFVSAANSDRRIEFIRSPQGHFDRLVLRVGDAALEAVRAP